MRLMLDVVMALSYFAVMTDTLGFGPEMRRQGNLDILSGKDNFRSVFDLLRTFPLGQQSAEHETDTRDDIGMGSRRCWQAYTRTGGHSSSAAMR